MPDQIKLQLSFKELSSNRSFMIKLLTSALMSLRKCSEEAESLKNFEIRFSVALANFNSFSSNTKLPRCITSLMLLNNASTEHSQHVSVLSLAAPTGTSFPEQASNEDFLNVVTYLQVSSIVKQCEMSKRATSSVVTMEVVVPSAHTIIAVVHRTKKPRGPHLVR